MKSQLIIPVLSLLFIATTNLAHAGVSDDLEGLGGNKELVRRARAIDPDNKIRVVQNRTVDRDLRLEFGIQGGLVTGGDPYVSTNTLGVNLDFHINPHWSIGARYYNSANSLSAEGKRVFSAASEAKNTGAYYERPEIDYASNTYIGVLNWYPVYGKLNFLDLGIAQFDMYFLGGAGQIELQSGPTSTYTAGGGVGLWLHRHVSARIEARYQTYEDQLKSGSRRLDLTILTATLGFLL